MPTIDSLLIQVNTNADVAASGLDKLAASLAKVKSITRGGLGLTTVNNQLKKLTATLGTAETTAGAEQLAKISNSLTGISSSATGATTAMKAFNKTASASKTKDTSLTQLANIGLSLYAIQLAGKTIGSAVEKSNAYVENLNLFTVAMGEYANEALNYANQVEEVMGIDSSEWIRNQGIFKQIASGFGLAEKSAYTFSQGLTQVAYDIASFYNISTDDAMQKVQAGIAGEIEPMRRLGYAIDQNSLQQIANARGINMRVTQMNQAQKAELRYVAIMEQSQNAVGDMSRTINTSANQMRILKAQVSQLGRAFGNLLIPMVNAVLPVLINFVNVVARVLSALAGLFGFSFPSIDYGGLTGAADAAGELGNNIGGAGGAAKELKRTLMGFDELNLLQDTSAGGGGGGGGGGAFDQLGGLGLDLKAYDFLGNLDSVLKKLTPIQALITSIGVGLLGWTVTQLLLAKLMRVGGLLGTIGALALEVANVGIMVGLVFTFDKRYNETGDLTYLVADSISSVMSSAISYKVLGSLFGSTAAWTSAGITLGISAATTIFAGYQDTKQKGYWDTKRIGDDVLAVVKGALAGAAVGFIIGGPVGAAVGAGIGFIVTAGVDILVTVAAVNASKRLKAQWGDVELTSEQAQKLAQALIDKNSNGLSVKITVAQAEIDKSDNLEVTYSNEWKSFVDEYQYQELVSSVGILPSQVGAEPLSASQLVAAGQQMLAGRTVKINALAQVFATDVSGDLTPAGEKVVSETTSINAALSEKLAELGRQLGDAYANGYEKGVTDIDVAKIYEELDKVNAQIQAYQQAKDLSLFNFSSGLVGLSKKAFDTLNDEYDKKLSELTEKAKQQAIEYEAELRGNAAIRATQLSQIMADFGTNSEEYAAALDNYRNSVTLLAEALGQEDLLKGLDLSTMEGIAEALNMLPPIDAEEWANKSLESTKAAVDKMFADAIKTATAELDLSGAATDFSNNLRLAFMDTDVTLMTPEYLAKQGSELFKAISDNILAAAGIDIDLADKINLSGFDILGEDAITALFADMEKTLGTQKALNLAGAMGLGDTLANMSLVSTEAQELLTELKELGLVKASPEVNLAGDAMTRITALTRDLNNLPTNKTVNVDVNYKELRSSSGGRSSKVTRVSMHASGGIPTQGSLFIAGEDGAGPEIVGKINGKTGVANSGQISEIIATEMARQGGSADNSAAVGRAVAEALDGVEVVCDGERMGRIAVKSINKYQRRTGRVELQF